MTVIGETILGRPVFLRTAVRLRRIFGSGAATARARLNMAPVFANVFVEVVQVALTQLKWLITR